MSHFTYLKTSFQNLFYLKKALSLLNIPYKQKKNDNITKYNLIIPQQNGSNIEFVWNGQEYELILDISFWEQPYPIENFIDKITQQYASQAIVGESSKIGFQPVRCKQNNNNSNTLILERWNSSF